MAAIEPDDVPTDMPILSTTQKLRFALKKWAKTNKFTTIV